MKKLILFLVLSCAAAFAQNDCNPLPIGSTAGGGTGGVTLAGQPYTGLNITDAAGVLHQPICVMADGTIVFPLGRVAFGGSVTQGVGQPRVEISYNASGRGGMVWTNTNPTSRGHSLLLRSCVSGCGTDFNFTTDSTTNGAEDIQIQDGVNQPLLYITGNCTTLCPPGFGTKGVGTKQFLISDGSVNGRTNPLFGFVAGHIAHGLSTVNLDNWGTATCAASTATVNFNTVYSTTTYQVMLTDQTTAGGARVSTKNVGSMVITCTGATDSVDYLVLGNPY